MFGAVSTLAEAALKLSVDGSKFDSGLTEAEKKARDTSQRIQDGLTKIGRVATVAFAGGVASIIGFTSAFADAEQSTVKLEQSLARIGQSSALTGVQAQIDEISSKMGQDDEMLADQVSKLTLRTQDARQAVEALQAAENLSAGTNLSLEQAVQAVGRAYDGNTMMLDRVGVHLSENAKGMQAVGEINKRFAGDAERYSESTEASLNRLKVASGNLAEDIGSILAPTVTGIANNFTEWTRNLDDTTKKMIAMGLLGGTALAGIVGPLATATGMVMQFRMAASLAQIASASGAAATGTWGAALVAFATGPVGIAIAALGALLIAANAAKNAMDNANMADNQGGAAGGPIQTAPGVFQSPGEMSRDTGREGSLGIATNLGVFAVKGQLNAQANRESQSRGYANSADELSQLKKQAEAAREWNKMKGWNSGQVMDYENSGNPLREWQQSHSQSARQQLRGATGLR